MESLGVLTGEPSWTFLEDVLQLTTRDHPDSLKGDFCPREFDSVNANQGVTGASETMPVLASTPSTDVTCRLTCSAMEDLSRPFTRNFPRLSSSLPPEYFVSIAYRPPGPMTR